MKKGLDVTLYCLDVSSHLRPRSRASVNEDVAIDTNILSTIDKEHFDEDTYSRLQ
jgi:hypothetical protein